MSYRLRVAKRAESQIAEAAQWWLDHRPKAPGAFEEDLEKAFVMVSSLPKAGQSVHHAKIEDLRRLLMGRVRFYLYYTVNDTSETVEILALWHASRGKSPRLGR